MLIYFTIFSVFVFSVVMSAIVGFLVYQTGYRFLPSTVIRHILGIGVAVLIGCLMTKLLLFRIWYFYVVVIGVAIILYIVFIKSSINTEQR